MCVYMYTAKEPYRKYNQYLVLVDTHNKYAIDYVYSFPLYRYEVSCCMLRQQALCNALSHIPNCASLYTCTSEFVGGHGYDNCISIISLDNLLLSYRFHD